MDDVQNLLKNKNLRDFFEKDEPQFLLSIFLIYTIKREYPDLTHYSIFQFNSKIRALKVKRNAVIYAYSLVQKTPNLSIYINDAFEWVYSVDNEIIFSLLQKEIIQYFEKIGSFEDDVEKLEKRFITAQLGDIYVVSSYLKRYMFEDKPTMTSISYNFYNDIINYLVAVFYDLKGIKYLILPTILSPSRKYTNIIIFPPYGNQTLMQKMIGNEKSNENISASVEWKIITSLLQYLQPNGKLVSILSSGVLNKVADAQSRRFLIDQKMIEAVIELPKLSLVSFPLSLISFSYGHSQISVINATKFAQNLRRGINLDSDKIVRALNGQIEGALGKMDLSYAKGNDYDLTPHRFFEETATDFINPTPLKKLTTAIFRGFQIPSKMLDEYASDNETKIKLVTLSSIEDGTVLTSELQSLKGIDKKMEHYILEKGDLVISCKGKSFKTAVIDVPYGETYISTGSIIVIRPKMDVLDSTYLKIFLDSSLGTTALRRIQTGASVLSLNPSKLQNIQIPLPHLSKQMLIGSSYKYKQQNINEVKDVIDQMKKEMDYKFDDNFLQLLN